MARLVISGIFFLSITYNHTLSLHAHQHLVLCRFEIRPFHLGFALSSREQSSLVHEVFEVSTGKARGTAGYFLKDDILIDRDVPCVDLKYFEPSLYVGLRNDN